MTCVANFPREQCRRHAMLAAYLVALVLASCTQGVADNRSYAPYSPENNGNMHDSGGAPAGSIPAG